MLAYVAPCLKLQTCYLFDYNFKKIFFLQAQQNYCFNSPDHMYVPELLKDSYLWGVKILAGILKG